MSAESARTEAAQPKAGRLPVLIWLAWRFLPPLDRRDQRTLTWVAVSCAYLAVPTTVGLAAARMPAITLLSLLCLAVPALPSWWLSAIRLGDRRRETALALRQARINTRAAAATSISRQILYPGVGSIVGTALISALHRPLGRALPAGAPLSVAIKDSSGHWLVAASIAVLLLVGMTAALGSARSAELYRWIKKLAARLDRREAAPQPQ